MRHWMIFGLAMLVSFGMSDIAEAGKKKKGDDTEAPADAGGDEAAGNDLTIGMTGVADVDNIFTKAVAPIENISNARTQIDGMNASLTAALGLPAGTPFADALADLKTKAEGNITMAMDEKGMPTLTPADAAPSNVTDAVEAVNKGIANAGVAMVALGELPAQVQEVIAAAQSFNPQSLISSGVKPLEAPKLMKTIGANLKVLKSAPEEAKMLIESVTQMTADIKGTFGGGDAG